MIDVKNIGARDKAVLIGLFLSRFDKAALNVLGFAGFRQAYNVLGYSIGFLPKSIQNYRDEFDPYFPNQRKGWRNRNLRDYCKYYMERTAYLSFGDFYELIRSFIETDVLVNAEDVVIRPNSNIDFSSLSPIANRLITGKAAEEYFKMNYNSIDAFKGSLLTETTHFGCGFDFKLTLNANRFYVEVKGLNEKCGSVLMTDKEFQVANVLLDKYCLFVVRNFKEEPTHELYFNPLHHDSLHFVRQEKIVTQISYASNLRL